MVHFSWIGNDGFSFADLEKYQKRCSTEKSKFALKYQHDVIPVYNAAEIDLRKSSSLLNVYLSIGHVRGQSHLTHSNLDSRVSS